MSIQKNDDVVFTFTATIEGSKVERGVIYWLWLRTVAGRIEHFAPRDYNFVDVNFFDWTPTEKRARISFAARVVMLIHKDGELVALQVANKHGKVSTVRFSEYGELLYTNLSDDAERNVA